MNMVLDPLGIAVISAFSGALLASIFNYYFQNRNEKKQCNALRKLLKIEFHNNLKKISKSFNSVIKEFDENNNNQSYSRLKEFSSSFSVIKFKQDLWNKKTPIYAIALTESEIYQIEDLYHVFGELSFELSNLTNALNKMDGEKNFTDEEIVLINNLSKDSWIYVEKTVKDILDKGDILMESLGK